MTTPRPIVRAAVAGAAMLAMLAVAACGPSSSAGRPGQGGVYYADRPLTLVVAARSGGKADTGCSALARALHRWLPGSPRTAVRVVPEQDGLEAINTVAAAPADGATLLCGPVSVADPLLRRSQLKADLGAFTYLVSFSNTLVFYARTDIDPGIKTPADIFDAHDLIFGGASVASDKDLPARAALNLLGAPYRYVTGITSDEAGRTAVQQGLVNSALASLSDYAVVTGPKMADKGVVIPVFQTGLPDAAGALTLRDSGLPATPTFLELYRKHFGKDPPHTGDWETVRLLFADQSFGRRTVAAPPGVPPQALAALRQAMAQLPRDPDFLADAHEAYGATMQIYPGDRMQKAMADALSAPAASSAALHALVLTGLETSTQ